MAIQLLVNFENSETRDSDTFFESRLDVENEIKK